MTSIKKNEAEKYLNAGAEAYQRGDYEKAIRLYKRASALGNVVATSNLGYCYYYGRSVPVNKEMAKKYWERAASLGDIAAIYKLGDMYRFGDLEKNLAYSNALYIQAFKLALNSDDYYVYPDAILRMLQYCPDELDKKGYNKRLLAQLCVSGVQMRIAEGDRYSEKVLEKAETILKKLDSE